MQKYISGFFIVVILCAVVTGCGSSSGSNSATGSTITVSGSTSTLGAVSISKAALQFNESTTASATFTKADGTPASGIQVLFTTTTGILNPVNGVVTTGNNGTATIQLTSGSTSGQGQITGTATVDNHQVSKTALFSVNLPALKLANLSFVSNPTATIDYGSTVGLTVDVTDENGVLFTSPAVEVTFTSTQAASGKATISSPVQSVDGKVSTSYKALTALGSDTITATIAGSSKTLNLSINPLTAGSIAFISASPKTIGLKGMGGAGIQETSSVTFKVVDTSGLPKPNQPITFSLNTKLGGISMLGSEPFGSGNEVTSSTDQNGTATIIVQSGTISTPVRVTASTTVNGTKISTQSDQLVVSTGVPAQDGFSISMSKFNSESWNYDGVANAVIVRLTDHFHNPVPKGTAIYFTTEGGAIEPSCNTEDINPTIDSSSNALVCPITSEKGMCCVVWKSQSPRPADGRATILAYAVGEEAFLDFNGNGLADSGEFTNISEAYRDDNESATFNSGVETYVDFNSDNTFNAADTNYNGVLQGTAYVTASKSKHIFSNVVHIMGSSYAGSLIPSTTTLDPALNYLSPSSKSIEFILKDAKGNPMPVGTEVKTNWASYYLNFYYANSLDWSPQISGTNAYVVPDSISKNGSKFVLTISNRSTYGAESDILFTVTTPKGNTTDIPVTFKWNGIPMYIDPVAGSFGASAKAGQSKDFYINGGNPPFTVSSSSIDIAAGLTVDTSYYAFKLSASLSRDAPTVVAPGEPEQKTATITVTDKNNIQKDIVITYY